MRAERGGSEEDSGVPSPDSLDVSAADPAPDAEPPTEDLDAHPHRHHIPHPHLIEAGEDRWKWRGKIRQDPRKLFFYRIGVGIAGLLMMIAAIILGPLPGPGGIPLFLLGLAVWSSEFAWANRLMGWFKRQFHRYQGWSRGRRVLFWLVLALCAWTFAYIGLLLHGVPPWLPGFAQDLLRQVPGLH